MPSEPPAQVLYAGLLPMWRGALMLTSAPRITAEFEEIATRPSASAETAPSWFLISPSTLHICFDGFDRFTGDPRVKQWKCGSLGSRSALGWRDFIRFRAEITRIRLDARFSAPLLALLVPTLRWYGRSDY